jgi:lipid-A-disaccharide synthase
VSVKVYFSTSERSGLFYARLLGEELMRMSPGVEIHGLRDDGAERNELAPVGFAGGIRTSGSVLERMREIEHEVRLIKPDLFLAVAWSEPNTILGLRLRDVKGMRRVFFAPPQLWAWGRWRARLLKKGYHLLLALYPREARFMRSLGLNALFAGNPLKELLEPYFRERSTEPGRKRTIAMLPGSRKSEKNSNIALLREFAREWRKENPEDRFSWLFLTAGEAREESGALGEKEVSVGGRQRFVELAKADLALVTSGTASLETALMGIPQIVFYSMPRVEIALARTFTRVKHFALANLVMGKEVVTEIINPTTYDLMSLASKAIFHPHLYHDLGRRIQSELTPLTNESLSLELLLIDNRIGRVLTKEA